MKRRFFAVLMSMVMLASVLPATVNAEECTHENSYEVEAKEPTCEEWGHNAHTYCDDCEEAITEYKEYFPLGHDLDENFACTRCGYVECQHTNVKKVEAKEPTCEDDGHKGYDKCVDCEEWLTEVEWIDALGHNYENDICSRCGKEACKHLLFYVEKGKAPTCEESGWTDYRYCRECGETLQESEEIPALGHNYDENGDCLNCSFVAQVNGTKYKTLKEAVAAVEEGGTIELIYDASVEETIVINKSITISGAREISADLAGAILEITAADVTLKDLIVNNYYSEDASGMAVKISSGAKNLTLENAELKAKGAAGAKGVQVNAPVTIKGNANVDMEYFIPGNGVAFELNKPTIIDGVFTVKSNVAVHAKDGSEGSVINFNKGSGVSVPMAPKGELKGFFSFAEDDIELNIDGSVLYLNTDDEDSYMFYWADNSYSGIEITVTDCKLEAYGGNIVNTYDASKNTIKISGTTWEAHAFGKYDLYVPEELCAHVESDEETTEEAVAATCTTDGVTAKVTCTCCGKVTGGEVVKAIGHKEVVDAAVKATCTEAGKTEGKHCSVCEKVLVKQEEVPSTGHKEIVDAAVKATCTETGKTEGSHCSVCGEVFVKQEEISALGHEFVDNACTNEGCEAKISVDADTEDSIKKEEVTEDIKEVTVVENEKTNEAVSNIKTETLNVVTTIVTDEKAADKLVEDGVISKETKEAIQEAVNNGEVVETVISVEMLDVQDVSADVAAKINEMAGAELGENAKIQLLDVSLLIQANGKTIGNLHELGEKITITIAIPKELISENGKYIVVREHEGVTELLEATVNEDGTISFVTDRFSTYALGFVSTKTEVGSGTETGTETETGSGTGSVDGSSSDNVPKTGDSSNIMLLIAVMMMSVFAFVSVIVRRNKDN